MKAKFSFSLKYFALFAIIVSIAMSIQFIIAIAKFDIETTLSAITNFYPSDLEITMDGEGVSINQPLPYSIKTDRLNLKFLPNGTNFISNKMKTNLLTFDSDENIKTVDDFYKSDSYIIVTETKLYSYENNESNKVTITPIQNDAMANESFTINHELFQNIKSNFLQIPIIKNRTYVYLFAIFIPLIIFCGIFTGNLFKFIFSTIFIFIIVKIAFVKKNISFGKIYQLIIHSKTPIILIQLLNTMLMSFAKFRIPGVLLTIGFVTWTLIWISKLDSKEDVVTPVETPVQQ